MTTNGKTLGDIFPSKYLKATDLNGSDLTLTIKDVVFEPIGDNQEMKVVLYFKELPKMLALNKSNASTIGKIYGEILDGWIGQKITLYATEVAFKGETYVAIRVRIRKPQNPPTPPMTPALEPKAPDAWPEE